MPWLLLFFAMPIIEMYLLITVAGYIDACDDRFGDVDRRDWRPLKYQGLETLMRGTQKCDRVKCQPRGSRGAIAGGGGALMITPGFVTDAIGFDPVPANSIDYCAIMLARADSQLPRAKSPYQPPTDQGSGRTANY